MNRLEYAVWCQGYRCGHIDGKYRCGQYVLGEERDIDVMARDVVDSRIDPLPESLVEACLDGYRTGYVMAASGERLPEHIRDFDLPGEV